MKRFVYKTTNNINGKIYIGQHTTNNLDDGYLGSGVVLQKAFKKYGEENFSREIITYVDTKEDLDRTEEIFIKHYIHIVGKDEMYNIAEKAGGGGCHSEETKLKMSEARKGHHHSEETRKKMSATRKGHPVSEETRQKLSVALKGRQFTDEVKKKISEAQKGRPAWNKGLPGTFTGRYHTEETKLKMSVAQKNRPDHSKPVLCVETGEIYPSINEVSRHTNIDISTISNVCRGRLKTSGGFHWKYIEK